MADRIMTPAEMTLLVLAGGESTRMGTPKHLLPLPGGSLLDHILQRLGHLFGEVVVAGRNLHPMGEGVRVVEDVRVERCPLVGILSGLMAAKNLHSFVLACDMPFVEPRLIELLASKAGPTTDVVVPVIHGLYEPLCAVYARSLAGTIESFLDSGRSKTTCFFPFVRMHEVQESEILLLDSSLGSFANLNTPSEYRRHCASS
jgi:molybdopterin-guanine dinucleotide biosynthesis protein A